MFSTTKDKDANKTPATNRLNDGVKLRRPQPDPPPEHLHYRHLLLLIHRVSSRNTKGAESVAERARAPKVGPVMENSVTATARQALC